MLNTSRLLTCLPFLCLIFELKITSKARNSSYRELLLFIRVVFVPFASGPISFLGTPECGMRYDVFGPSLGPSLGPDV